MTHDDALEQTKIDLLIQREQISIDRELLENEQLRLEILEQRLHSEVSGLLGGVLYIRGEITEESALAVRRALDCYFTGIDHGDELVVDINSPGGDMMAGFDIYGILRTLSNSGVKITTVISGMAGSMAGVISQAGDVRCIREESILHIHEPMTMAFGSKSEIVDTGKWLSVLTDKLVRIYADRSKLTQAEIRKKMLDNREWFITHKEAKRHGFVDKVI